MKPNKLLSFLLALTLLLGLLPASALAAQDAFAISKESAAEGESFVVSFSQSVTQTVSTLDLGFVFDNTVFEAVSIDAPYTDVEPGTETVDAANENGRVAISYVDKTWDANTVFEAGTVLLSVTFRVKAGAAIGSYAFTVTDYAVGGAYDPEYHVMEDITPYAGVFTKSIAVTAGGIAAAGVTLNKNTLVLSVGSSETLSAAVSPANAADKTVTWVSDAPDVAAVDETGTVTALSAGSAGITVTTNDGGFTAVCSVRVTPPLEGDALTVSSPSAAESETFTVTFRQSVTQTVSTLDLTLVFDSTVFEAVSIHAPYTDMQPDAEVVDAANKNGRVTVSYVDPSHEAGTLIEAGEVLLAVTFRIKAGAAAGSYAFTVTDYAVGGAYDPEQHVMTDVTPDLAPSSISVDVTRVWQFDAASRALTVLAASVSEKKPVLLASYTAGGRLLDVTFVTAPGTTADALSANAGQVRLFWLDGSSYAPLCAAETVWLGQ